MGYKLAGCTVLGGVELDPRIMAVYRANFHPRFSYEMAVGKFNSLDDSSLPKELLELDILDGSPPCSSFSLSGSRSKTWGTKSFFAEGQAEQELDELFFDFIATVNRLRPKVAVAENVAGLVSGKAKWYVGRIFQAFADAGYVVQLFKCSASRMGVPQRRTRVFFIARRADLGLPALTLNFEEDEISVSTALAGVDPSGRPLVGASLATWKMLCPGETRKDTMYNHIRMHPDLPSPTVAATMCIAHWEEPRSFSAAEVVQLQTFPTDYNFLTKPVTYICGMAVPPFMMQRLALEIGRQWFGVVYDPEVGPLPRLP